MGDRSRRSRLLCGCPCLQAKRHGHRQPSQPDSDHAHIREGLGRPVSHPRHRSSYPAVPTSYHSPPQATVVWSSRPEPVISQGSLGPTAEAVKDTEILLGNRAGRRSRRREIGVCCVSVRFAGVLRKRVQNDELWRFSQCCSVRLQRRTVQQVRLKPDTTY